MLRDLYRDLENFETDLSGSEIVYFRHGSEEGNTIDIEKIIGWLKGIYSLSGETSDRSRKELANRKNWRLVGPMGELPLHVCFLRAYEFKSEFPELYREILDGAKEHIANFPEDAEAGYGKDYCAAALCAIKSNEIKIAKEGHDFPYTRNLHEIVMPSFSTNSDDEVGWLRRDKEIIQTRGLYEGETVIYFAISNKDVSTVQYLLEKSECR